MRSIVVLAWVAWSVARGAAPDCPRGAIEMEARQLGRQAMRVERVARGSLGYWRVADEANALQRALLRLADGVAANTACHQLERDFREEVLPEWNGLLVAEQHAQRQRTAPSVREATASAERIFAKLRRWFRGKRPLGSGF